MTAEKTLTKPRAYVGTDERGHPLPHVRLYGFAGWIKSEPMVTADLSPLAALALAEQLVAAAQVALKAAR